MQKIKIGCVVIGVWAFLVGLAELLPAIPQLIYWLGSFGRYSINEAATKVGLLSWLSFHGLPSALACPLFFAVGLVSIFIADSINKLQDFQRRKRGDLTQEEIDQAIQARKQQAENKEIAKKVERIILTYGTMGTYRNDSLELSKLDKKLTVRLPPGADRSQVFEAQFIPSYSYKTERTVLRPDYVAGQFEIATEVDYTHIPGRYEIQAYIPGDWEAAIENLYTSARRRLTAAKENRDLDVSAAKKAIPEEERKRFGI